MCYRLRVTKPIGRAILVLGGVIVLGSIMSILDATIVNVAVPTLARRFGASVAAIQWVVTAYLLAFAAVIPLTGWLTRRFGAKRVWIAALTLFMAGSVLAGLSWSLGSLVLFRVVQGFGGGLIMPVGQAILARAAGRERMGRVMTVIGIPMLLAPVFGPVVGGLLVDEVSWRWIFFVNLPVGVLALLLAVRLLPPSPPQPVQRLDVRGLALLPPGLALAVYGVALVGALGLTKVEGHTSYAFLASALFVIGLGLGSTIMPAMAVAFQSVPRDAVEQATSTINVVQRLAGSLGTALLAVVLQRQLPAHS